MFPITMSITVSNTEELNRVMSVLTLGSPVAAVKAPKEKPEGPKAQPAAKPEPAATQPTAAASAAPEPKAEPSEPSAIDFVTQIQQPIVKMAATGKREAAIKILAEFGAKKASEIAPKDYPRAVELIQAALKEE